MERGVHNEFGQALCREAEPGDTVAGDPTHRTPGVGFEELPHSYQGDEASVAGDAIENRTGSESIPSIAVFPDPSKTDGFPTTWRGEGILPLVGHAGALAAYRKQHPRSAVPKRYRRFIDEP